MENNGLVMEVPEYTISELRPGKTKYCICIPVINEGRKISDQLARMKDISHIADIIIADGGSTDGSTTPEYLRSAGVRTLLVKTGPGKLSAQLRMAYHYALIKENYSGVITIDGNNKDGVEAIPAFIEKLDAGYDFVQGSRFIPGGQAINTPRIRHLAVKLIHIPVISSLAGFRFTDTTNGFRAYSGRLLLDPRIQVFRKVFSTYELLAYLSVKAPRLGFRVVETPVSRAYPLAVKTPTKISAVRGNIGLLRILLYLGLGYYDYKGGKR